MAWHQREVCFGSPSWRRTYAREVIPLDGSIFDLKVQKERHLEKPRQLRCSKPCLLGDLNRQEEIESGKHLCRAVRRRILHFDWVYGLSPVIDRDRDGEDVDETVFQKMAKTVWKLHRLRGHPSRH